MAAVQVLGAGIACAVLAACTQLPVGHVYLSEPTYGVYLALPNDWTVLEASKETQGNYIQGFGGPGISPETILRGGIPSGHVSVRVVAGTFDSALEDGANSAITNLQDAVESGAATITAGPTETQDSASVTREWVLKVLLDPDSAPTMLRQRVIVSKNPIARNDEGSQYLIKSLIVGCNVNCYEDNTADIGTVFDSWKVT